MTDAKYPITAEAMENAAQALALSINGGFWNTDYTEAQKNVWRERVARAMGQTTDLVAKRDPEALVTFLYRNHAGKVAMRKAWPITIMFGMSHWHPEPQWLLEGLDAEKNEVRHYALKDCAFNVPEWSTAEDESGTLIPPTEPGHYFVMLPGDSESIDGHVIYEFGDWMEMATWEPAKPAEFEDFAGGHKGEWTMMYGETDGMIGWCGPFHTPPFPDASNG